ncbi:flavoprotein [Planosporangium sp. 12N6]|uniref:flavoprotein n=1 Tax=Planosporangium spinosum TaxID=3402278 RepID=UPI003CF22E13
MVILSRTAGMLRRITGGLAEDLIERAADVVPKQRRTLLRCLRDAPLNLIHLRTMMAVTEARTDRGPARRGR